MPTQCVREEYGQVDGRRVRFLLAPPDDPGDGTSPLHLPTLLLHGLGCSSEVWLPTIEEMDRRDLSVSVIAPDMPGYGKSRGPREALDMVELADWAVRFADMRGLDRVHVAGNSMGCQVALALARRHPDRVGGMVLQGPTTGTRLIPPWRYVVGLIADGSHETLPYNLRLAKMYAQMGPRRYFATVKKMLADDPLAESEKVVAPCLIIRGGEDAIVSDEVARRLAAALPDAVYAPLDHAAHAIEYNQPVEFTDALVTFLARTEEKLGIPAALQPPGAAEKNARSKSHATAPAVSTIK